MFKLRVNIVDGLKTPRVAGIVVKDVVGFPVVGFSLVALEETGCVVDFEVKCSVVGCSVVGSKVDNFTVVASVVGL